MRSWPSGTTASDPPRQRARADESPLSGVKRQIELVHSAPSVGKADAERARGGFHGRLREECLTVSWFQNLFDAQRKIAAWRKGDGRGPTIATSFF